MYDDWQCPIHGPIALIEWHIMDDLTSQMWHVIEAAKALATVLGDRRASFTGLKANERYWLALLNEQIKILDQLDNVQEVVLEKDLCPEISNAIGSIIKTMAELDRITDAAMERFNRAYLKKSEQADG